ncbi:hypothetical protein ABZW10_24070 [Kitasatospora sp. NPDC004723]|uniref:hypothetical protein n=1 Tax=Kitasatospora sp. NPDC004723 TaxID=3154288 RepID=UPI00339F19C2
MTQDGNTPEPPARRRRPTLEEIFEEDDRNERATVRALREFAARHDGSVHRTLREMAARQNCACGPVEKADEILMQLGLAFDLDPVDAARAACWSGLGLGGTVSDAELAEAVGTRFVARPEHLRFGSSDFWRTAGRQARTRTPLGGEDSASGPPGEPLIVLDRSTRLRSYTAEDRRLVLQSGDGRPGFGRLEVEFRDVREMTVLPEYDDSLTVTEEPGPGPYRHFLLAGGRGGRGAVHCASVHLYHSEPAGAGREGDEPPDPWGT